MMRNVAKYLPDLRTLLDMILLAGLLLSLSLLNGCSAMPTQPQKLPSPPPSLLKPLPPIPQPPV